MVDAQAEPARAPGATIDRPACRRVVVVLPGYNEALNLPGLLDRVASVLVSAALDYSIVVVDDGSSDDTPAILAERKGRVPLLALRHAHNQGLGPTIRDGLLRATEVAAAEDIIVSMDADGSHDPALVPEMVRMINEGCDVVIASRYQPNARVFGLAWHRRIFSRMASLLFRLAFPTRGLRDYTCGFRAYRASVVKQAFTQYGDDFVDQQGFQCMVDILLKLRKLHVVIGEVPMVLRYDLKQGSSKMKIAKTSLATVGLLFRRRLGW